MNLINHFKIMKKKSMHATVKCMCRLYNKLPEYDIS